MGELRGVMVDMLERLKTALVDRYMIEREIGRGGMATVYLAHDVKHDRKVAVKVLRPELAAVLGAERFLSEIKVTANLQHPHILALFDSGEADGFLYYVMPYVEGESLREKLNREKQLAVVDALRIASQIADALGSAHRQGIMHRDIKPENILLSEGHAVVADFGIALAVNSAGGERLTETGLSLGTPAYMSPEQVVAEQDLDARSDIYSLACVLYEMLAGDPPFVASTPQAVLARHVTDPVPPITTVRSSVSAPAAAAITRALGKAPVDRFDSAEAFSQALITQAAEVGPETKSIVVLPFDNLSPDPDNAFFADGLTEELIADLSKVRALKVISRTSAVLAKESKKDVPTIARELNVRYVLEGSVRRAGNNLRITAQLIDAQTDIHLWAEKYAGQLEDVFDLQETVSRRIVEALELQLSPEEEQRISVRPISNIHAYECYLQARQEIWRFTEESLDRALKLLDDGLSVVGDNELLYAAKGSVYWQYVNVGLKPVGEYESCIREAHTYADKALALNPDSAVGHVLKGQVYQNSCEPKQALRHFLRAVELDASNPEALFWVGYMLAASGRESTSRPYIERAVEVDPLTPMTRAMLGWPEFFEGRFDLAMEMWLPVYEADTESLNSRFWMAWGNAMAGQVDQALVLTDGITADSRTTLTSIVVFLRNVWGGRSEEAMQAATADLLEAARWDDLWSLMMAEGYAMIGEHQRAMDMLECTIRFGICNVSYLSKHDPFLENIRGEPRFAELMDLARDVARDLGSEIESFTPPWKVSPNDTLEGP